MMLLFMSIFVFGCIGVEIITKSDTFQADPELKEIVVRYFNTLPRTMVTLCRFVSFDSIGAVYEPLMYESPGLVVYFGCIAMVISICLMNLVTAVLVDTCITSTQKD